MPLDGVRVLNVFLASPGGLDAERDAVAQVANTLNPQIAHTHRATITLLRWEQMIGMAGNPQAQINPSVDECDLFIGIVNRRWGTDTGNGFDSGFSEEFTRALERWNQTNSPRIALFFKAIDGEALRDPGPELQKVLAFQKRIEEEHTAFFNVFNSVDELKYKLLQLLFMSVINIPPGESTEAVGTPSKPPTNTASPDSETGSRAEPNEISSILTAFVEITASRSVDIAADVDRLEFFGLAVSRDKDPIPTHLANRMFNRRKRLSLEIVETRAWFRTYLIDLGAASKASNRVIPFASVVGGAPQLQKLIAESADVALESDNKQLVAGWLRLATALEVRPQNLWPTPPLDEARQTDYRKAWLRASTHSKLAITYWLKVRRRQDLQLAKILASEQGETRELGEALVGILSQKRNAEALARLMPDLLIDPIVSKAFMPGRPMETLATPNLERLALLSYTHSDVRLAALDELIRREAVSSSVIEAVLKDQGSHFLAREAWSTEASKRLFNRAAPDSFLAQFLNTADQLREKWPNPTRTALVLLARHNTMIDEAITFKPEGKTYMDPTQASMMFKRYEGTTEALDDAESILAGENSRVDAYLEGLRNAGADAQTEEFARESFDIAAIRYISKHPHPKIRKLYRERLRDFAVSHRLFYDEVTECLIDMFEPKDIDLLLSRLRLANETTASRARATIAHSASLSRLNGFLDAREEETALAALAELQHRERLPSRRRLMSLMRSSMSDLRMAATSALIGQLEDAELSEVLRTYISSGEFYYYSVVCEFDRAMAQIPSAYPE